MEAECRFKADNTVGHTATCEDDAMIQIEVDFWPDIESPADLLENSTIDRSFESLPVDSEFLQLGRTNNGPSFGKGIETTHWRGSRHIWV
jgi:hypothetical protein